MTIFLFYDIVLVLFERGFYYMKININKEKFNGETFILDKETRIEGRLASDIKPWLKYYDTDDYYNNA